MNKNPSKKTLTNKLDRECSRVVRSHGKCVWGATKNCGQDKYELLQCCHIFSRQNRAVRWDLKNMLCMCAGCHFYAHQNPVLFGEFVGNYLGEYEYAALKNRANNIKRWTTFEMQDLLTAFHNL